MVTDILQLPQVVGGDDGGHIPLLHVRGEEALHRLAHHRVQPVKGLVAEQIVRPGAEAAQHRQLLFHPLGECADLAASRKAETVQQLPVAPAVEPGIAFPVKFHHIPRRAVAQKMLVVGDVEESRLHSLPLVHRLPVDGNRPLIGL